MKIKIPIIATLICGLAGPGIAGTYQCTTTSTVPSGYSVRSSGVTVNSYCSSSTTVYTCNGTYRACDSFMFCNSCTGGRVPTSVTSPSNGYCDRITTADCCVQCSNCTSDTNWVNAGTGYMRRASRTCSCSGSCNTTYVYACATGYYGHSTNGTSGCTKCPTPSNNAYVTTVVTREETTVSDCYIPAGFPTSDSSGSYSYTANCYHS